MDLRCVECGAPHYTAARFARNLECSKCGGRLVVVPDRDRALLDADGASSPAPPVPDAPLRSS